MSLYHTRMNANGHLQVVVADCGERQCPLGHDGQERSRDNAPHSPAMQFANCYQQYFYLKLNKKESL